MIIFLIFNFLEIIFKPLKEIIFTSFIELPTFVGSSSTKYEILFLSIAKICFAISTPE